MGEQGVFVFLPHGQAGAVQHFNAVVLKAQHLIHVDDDAAVAAHKIFFGAQFFFHLRKAARGPALAVLAHHPDEMVLRHGVQHLAQRQLHGLAGNAHFQLRLGAAEHPPQLGSKFAELFFLIGFEQVIERVHREGVPHIFRRGGHEHDEHFRVCPAQLLGGLDAAGALHTDIQKHKVILPGGHLLQVGIPAGENAALHCPKLLPDQCLQPLRIRLQVLHDGDLQCHVFPSLSTSCHFYYSTLPGEKNLPFAHKTTPFAHKTGQRSGKEKVILCEKSLTFFVKRLDKQKTAWYANTRF